MDAVTIRTSHMFCVFCGSKTPISGKAGASQEDMEAEHVAWHSKNVSLYGWPVPTDGIEPVYASSFKRRLG